MSENGGDKTFIPGLFERANVNTALIALLLPLIRSFPPCWAIMSMQAFVPRKYRISLPLPLRGDDTIAPHALQCVTISSPP